MESTPAVTGEILLNGNWHAHWNVKSSACFVQWPTGSYHLRVNSWWGPMTLTLTVRGNKKLCLHFKSAWVSTHTDDMLQWSEKLQDTTPSNFTITGPDCCRHLKQLPQGDRSNLVYSSLSIHSSNFAQVITTSLSSPKSSPEVLSRKATFGSAVCLLNIDPNKHSIRMPRHFLDGLMFLLQVSVTQQSPLTQNTSVTLTHICRTGLPTPSQPWLVSLLECPVLLREDKQIFWFASNLQSTLSVGHPQPSKSRTSTPWGGYPLAQHPASIIVW